MNSKIIKVEKVKLTGGSLWRVALACGHLRWLMHGYKPKEGEVIKCKICPSESPEGQNKKGK